MDSSYNQNFYLRLRLKESIWLVPENIISLVIREWLFDFIPRIEITMNDDGLLSEMYIIEDNDKLEVIIAKDQSVDSDQFLHAEFLIQDWKIVQIGDNKQTQIQITGILDCPDLFYPMKTKSFKNKKSKDVLSNIAKESGMKSYFPLNYTTNDKMTWYQINQTNYEFLRSVILKSNKNDDAVLGYIKLDKTLYISSFVEEISKEKEYRASYDPINFSKSNFDNKEDENVIWFNYYNMTNLNGYFNKMNNYGVHGNYYDLTDSQDISVNNSININTDYLFKNKKANGQSVEHYNFGIENNVYEGFHETITRNDYYIKDFFSFNMFLNINPKINLNLLDKVQLVFPTLPIYSPNEINEIFTGIYLIGGIIHSISKGGIYKKEISIHRNGFNKSAVQPSYTSVES